MSTPNRNDQILDCSLCGQPFQGFGNNPFPLGEIGEDGFSGACCDDCNTFQVIPARLGIILMPED
jgi:hypothetical protein